MKSSTMTTRRYAASLAYPRREASARGATRIDRHALILVIGLLTLVALAGVLYLSQASVAAEMRFGLGGLEQEAAILWQEILTQRREIADRTRLAAVEERAARLGMVEAAAGPYVACTMPATTRVTARPPAERDEVARLEQPGGGSWGRLLSRLGLARSQVVADDSVWVRTAAQP